MARQRRRNTPAEDYFGAIVKASSVIPWWATLPIALLLYFLVPYGIPTEVQLQQPTDAIGLMLGIFFKAIFKYVVPMALVFGAVVNIFTGIKSFTLFSGIKKKGAHEIVQNLSWQDFEFLLSEWFKKQGYSTELTGGGGADGGVDIKLYKDGGLYLVQCKHYKAWKVSVNVVREHFGVMVAENAIGGFVVTSGKFTNDAHAFAKDKNIELIDGKKLESVLDGVETINTEETANNLDTCPRCGGNLVERSGKYGKFIGCSNYPKCRYTQTNR